MSATTLSLIAEARRQQILQAVWLGEVSAGELHRRLGSLTFGAVSQHLKLLRDAGLVSVRQEGRKRYYRARREGFGELLPALDAMWGQQLDRLKQLAEADQARQQSAPKKRKKV